MNDSTIPPKIPTPEPSGISGTTLAENPEDKVPITSVTSAFEAILRQPKRVMFQLRQPGFGNVVIGMLLIAFLCSVIYGVVVGTFSSGTQLWAAPIKVTMGLFISALICLPSLYIFSCLSGSQARLVEVFGLVAGLMALMTVLLIGFAPVAWVFSQSTESLAAMGSLHLVFWAIATGFGLRFLQNGFAQSNASSSNGLNVWIIIFMLVMLQMTTALRPLIGTAPTFLPTEKKFFLSHWGDCLNEKGKTKAADYESR